MKYYTHAASQNFAYHKKILFLGISNDLKI